MTEHKRFVPRREFLRSLTKKRVSASAMLFDSRGRLLLVKPWYKEYWALPGGSVDTWEAPSAACLREVKEEVGVRLKTVRPVAVFYDNRRAKRDEIFHFIFTGGRLSKVQRESTHIVDGEIEGVRFVPRNQIASYASPKFSRRLRLFLKAVRSRRVVYFEATE